MMMRSEPEEKGVRHGRRTASMRILARTNLRAVVPGAPITGNRDFANDAPDWMDTIAINSRPMGSRREEARPGFGFMRQKDQSKQLRAAIILNSSLLSNILLKLQGFGLVHVIFKIAVDGPQDLSIIRPTSGADETENFLLIK